MDAQSQRPSRLRMPNLLPHQLPLPLELPVVLCPISLPPTAEVVLPRQIWASLPLASQAQMQRTFVRVLQEVISDASPR